MLRLVLTRVALSVPMIVGVALVTFFAVRLVPGDPVHAYLGEDYDPKVAAELRAQLGLDRPLGAQFASWIGGLLHGDLGTSFRTHQAVTAELAGRLPATLELAVAALIVSLLIAIPVGVAAGRRPRGVLDVVARTLSVAGLSLPSFVIAVLGILVFAVWLRVLPSGGIGLPGSDLGTQLRYLALPAICLGIEISAITMRMTRSSVLEVSGLDYVRTAVAKGVSRSRITTRHILRNALVPVVTTVGIQVGALLGGALVIEKVFSWPGLGSLLVNSIQQRDYPLIQGVVMLLALLFVVASLVTDLLYIVLDPRLRRG
jgi:peptide/nickel transport system permease protein